MAQSTGTSASLRDQAVAQHKSGNLEAAISAYEALVRDNPDDADCLGLLAMALYQSGRYDEQQACR